MLAPTSLSLPDTHQSRQHVHLTLFEKQSEKQVNWRKALLSVYIVCDLTELGGLRFIRTDRENVWMWWWTEVKCGGCWGGGVVYHVAQPSERRTRLTEGLSRSSRPGRPMPRGEWKSGRCSSRSLPSLLRLSVGERPCGGGACCGGGAWCCCGWEGGGA